MKLCILISDFFHQENKRIIFIFTGAVKEAYIGHFAYDCISIKNRCHYAFTTTEFEIRTHSTTWRKRGRKLRRNPFARFLFQHFQRNGYQHWIAFICWSHKIWFGRYFTHIFILFVVRKALNFNRLVFFLYAKHVICVLNTTPECCNHLRFNGIKTSQNSDKLLLSLWRYHKSPDCGNEMNCRLMIGYLTNERDMHLNQKCRWVYFHNNDNVCKYTDRLFHNSLITSIIIQNWIIQSRL